jgi:hypothetical protein
MLLLRIILYRDSISTIIGVSCIHFMIKATLRRLINYTRASIKELCHYNNATMNANNNVTQDHQEIALKFEIII